MTCSFRKTRLSLKQDHSYELKHTLPTLPKLRRVAGTLRMRKPIHLKQRKMILLKVVQHLSPRVRGFRDVRFIKHAYESAQTQKNLFLLFSLYNCFLLFFIGFLTHLLLDQALFQVTRYLSL